MINMCRVAPGWGYAVFRCDHRNGLIRGVVALACACIGGKFSDVAALAATADLTGVDPGGIGCAFDQTGHARDGSARTLAMFAYFLRSHLVAAAYQSLQNRVDDCQRRTKLMRDHGSEIAVQIGSDFLPLECSVQFLRAGSDQIFQVIPVQGQFTLCDQPFSDVGYQQYGAYNSVAVSQ